MKELDLKSATAQPQRRPKMVRMKDDVQFFGINGKQITDGQSGHIRLEWRPNVSVGVVVVTSSTFPGQERWLFGGDISWLAWDES